MPARLPLKAYRVTPRKPFVEVDAGGGSLELFLPGYFGRHRWTIDLDDVSVVDLAHADAAADAADEVLATPARVPYLFTTGPATTPNLGLLFKRPRRTPPVRPLAAFAPNSELDVGAWESRSGGGGDLDGVLLRFEDPDTALSAFLDAGVDVVTDVPRWFRTHRRVVSGPVDADVVVRRYRNLRWLSLSGYLFLGIAIVSASIVGSSDSWSDAVLPLGAAALGIAFPMLARRLLKRERRRAMGSDGVA